MRRRKAAQLALAQKKGPSFLFFFGTHAGGAERRRRGDRLGFDVDGRDEGLVAVVVREGTGGAAASRRGHRGVQRLAARRHLVAEVGAVPPVGFLRSRQQRRVQHRLWLCLGVGRRRVRWRTTFRTSAWRSAAGRWERRQSARLIVTTAPISATMTNVMTPMTAPV